MHPFPVTRHWMGRNKNGDPVLTVTLAGGRAIRRFVRNTLIAEAKFATMGQEILAAPVADRYRRADRTRDGFQKHHAVGTTDPVVTIVLVGWNTIHQLAFIMLSWQSEFVAMGREILRSHLAAIGPDAWKELWARSHGTRNAPMDLSDTSMTTVRRPLAEAVRTLRRTLYQDGGLSQPFKEDDTVEVSVQSLHTVLCSLKLTAPPTGIAFAAENIVNQLADHWEVPVDVRQATNDRSYEFAAQVIRTTHPSRETTGQCGDPGCAVFVWGTFAGIDSPVLLCTAHRQPAPGWAYEAAAQP